MSGFARSEEERRDAIKIDGIILNDLREEAVHIVEQVLGDYSNQSPANRTLIDRSSNGIKWIVQTPAELALFGISSREVADRHGSHDLLNDLLAPFTFKTLKDRLKEMMPKMEEYISGMEHFSHAEQRVIFGMCARVIADLEQKVIEIQEDVVKGLGRIPD